MVDQHGAALLALGTLAALIERGRTGQGLHVELTMLHAALDLQLEILTYFLNGARMEKSPTSLASMFHPGPYGVYETADGHLVLSMSPLGALRDALGLTELAPYAGVTWRNKWQGTAELAEQAGESTGGPRFVAGLRFWW